MAQPPQYTSTQLQTNFQKYDKDHNGYVDRNEIREVYRRHGKEVDERTLDEIMKRYDYNRDGKLNYQEFVMMLTKGQGPADSRIMSQQNYAPQAGPVPGPPSQGSQIRPAPVSAGYNPLQANYPSMAQQPTTYATQIQSQQAGNPQALIQPTIIQQNPVLVQRMPASPTYPLSSPPLRQPGSYQFEPSQENNLAPHLSSPWRVPTGGETRVPEYYVPLKEKRDAPQGHDPYYVKLTKREVNPYQTGNSYSNQSTFDSFVPNQPNQQGYQQRPPISGINLANPQQQIQMDQNKINMLARDKQDSKQTILGVLSVGLALKNNFNQA